MIAKLKRLVYLIFNLSRVRMHLRRRQIDVFDIVSQIENPREAKDLFIVYSIDEEEIGLIPWTWYTKSGRCQSTLDNILLYPRKQFEETFYKVENQMIDPHLVILHSSSSELKVLSTRINRVFGILNPLMGIFIDSRNKHQMFVATKVGDVAKGFSIVYDLTLARTAGIIHNDQIAHIVKTKDLIDTQAIRPIYLEDIVNLFNNQWRKEVIKDITWRMFRAIQLAERRITNMPTSAKDVTMLKEIQTGDSTMTQDKIPEPPPNITQPTRKLNK